MASSLLEVSRSRIDPHRPSSLLLPISVALVNLLVCVLFESPIKEDPSGRALSIFLFVQGWALFLLTLIHLATAGAEILRKTLVMPVTPSARLAFAFISSARHQAIQALIFTDMFFLLVVYHQSAVVMIAIPLLVALMAADILALASFASAAAIRRSRPPTIVAAYSTLSLLGIMVITLLFHMPAAFGMLPPMSWTSVGIMAAGAGKFGWMFLCGAASGALLLVTMALGRRFV